MDVEREIRSPIQAMFKVVKVYPREEPVGSGKDETEALRGV